MGGGFSQKEGGRERERQRGRQIVRSVLLPFHGWFGALFLSLWLPHDAYMRQPCVCVPTCAAESTSEKKKKQKKESGLCGQPTKAALDFAEFSFRNFAEEKEIQLYLSGSIFLVN